MNVIKSIKRTKDSDDSILNVDKTINESKLIKKVNDACREFKEIQKDYKNTGVNPAMVIQISNAKLGEEQLQIIKNTIVKNELL
jgi:hypothetical protein